jgi:hypothetical protein
MESSQRWGNKSSSENSTNIKPWETWALYRQVELDQAGLRRGITRRDRSSKCGLACTHQYQDSGGIHSVCCRWPVVVKSRPLGGAGRDAMLAASRQVD